MNCIQLIGNMVKDPELKTNTAGATFTNFTIAVSRMRGDDGADFIDCCAFGKTAEVVVQYLKKGNRFALTGKLRVNLYDGKDGKRKKSVDVMVDHIEFLEKRQAGDTAEAPAEPAPTFEELGEGEDFPF